MLPEPLFALLQRVIPQHLLSRITGKFAASELPWLKNFLISKFVAHYQVNMSEALIENPKNFASFNDFFTRELKAGARTITDLPNTIACPADGAISEIGDIQTDSILQAKGQHYSLTTLLAGDKSLSDKMLGGKFATIYLSPKDYHRVHMPVDGTLVSMTYVPGDLFSVNQATANQIPGLFARNERLICHFDSSNGEFVVILVGAMIVAGIETVWAGEVAPAKSGLHTIHYKNAPAIHLKKGAEMGRFKLGSTAILLFPKNTKTFNMNWESHLTNGSATRLGESIGYIHS